MKNLLIITFISLLSFAIACTSGKQHGLSINDLNWLKGHWERVHIKEGRSAHERWVAEGTGLKGWGVAFQGVDTSFVEVLYIVSRGDTLYYVAEVSENPDPVYFRITSITAHGFICENPKHDFPQKITYQLENDTLNAVISGNDRESVFEFVKKD